MKRYTVLFLALLLILVVCACGKNVRVEGGGANREAAGAILIGTDF